MRCYVICSGPRAGSHYLADLLQSTRVAGTPDDYFNPLGAGSPGERRRPEEVRYSTDYVARLISRTETPNGVFGIMIQFNQAANHVGLTRLNGIFPNQPKYVFLRRRNEVRQAVSLAIARQTGQFLSTQKPERVPDFNADQIRCCLEDVRNHNRGWETYFWELGIEPLPVWYEDCVESPVETTDSILTFVGGVELRAAASAPTTSLQRQANEVNEKWTIRYMQNPPHAASTGEATGNY